MLYKSVFPLEIVAFSQGSVWYFFPVVTKNRLWVSFPRIFFFCKKKENARYVRSGQVQPLEIALVLSFSHMSSYLLQHIGGWEFKPHILAEGTEVVSLF